MTDNPPAFPISVQPDFQYAEPGMTLRDYFASQALVGLASHYGTPNGAEVHEIPRRAFIIADAMLKERNK